MEKKQRYKVVGARFVLTTFEDKSRKSVTFKKDDTFLAFPSQIPAGFKDLLKEVPVEEEMEKEVEQAPPPEEKKERVAVAQPPFRRRG